MTLANAIKVLPPEDVETILRTLWWGGLSDA
jgi:hypothetical protein